MQVKVFLKLCLSVALIWECVGSVCPGIRQPGAAALVNESLCFETRCFVSYDKSVGAQTLPLQRQC